MRNKETTSTESKNPQSADLQRQIEELQRRVSRLESITPAPDQPNTAGRFPENQRAFAIGDLVRFRSTKITKGGDGRIIRIVRNFVIIQRQDGTTVQRSPRNICLISRAGQQNGN